MAGRTDVCGDNPAPCCSLAMREATTLVASVQRLPKRPPCHVRRDMERRVANH